MKSSQYLHQTWELTLASLKSRYRKTFAGFLWVILGPLMMFGVQALIFKHVLKIQLSNYLLFLMSGLLPWIFFTSTVQMGTPLFVTQSQLLRSFKVNPWVILGAQVMDSFINFLASFFIILMPFIFFTETLKVTLIFLPLSLIPLLLGTLCLTITLSILNVFYRDINFVMGFLFSVLYFLTPIFYPEDFLPENLRWMVLLNPVWYFIKPFRAVLYEGDLSVFFLSFTKGIILSLLFGGLSLFIWKRKRNDFYRFL